MEQRTAKAKALQEIKERIEDIKEMPEFLLYQEFALQINSSLELSRFINQHVVEKECYTRPAKKQLSSVALSLLYS